MILQFLFSMLATASFAVLLGVPKKEFLYSALTGAFGRSCYLISCELETSPVFASLLATFFLTILSRFLAAQRKNPVTLYLVVGILPLVPGAGIYDTSYYFIMNEATSFAAKGMETFKIAGAITIGIIFGFSLPQSLFQRLRRKQKN